MDACEEGMPERGRLVRLVLPLEDAHRKEANPFGHGLEVGGRAARAPASPTFLCPLQYPEAKAARFARR